MSSNILAVSEFLYEEYLNKLIDFRIIENGRRLDISFSFFYFFSEKWETKDEYFLQFQNMFHMISPFWIFVGDLFF
jgi:hypothetical protein